MHIKTSGLPLDSKLSLIFFTNLPMEVFLHFPMCFLDLPRLALIASSSTGIPNSIEHSASETENVILTRVVSFYFLLN